MTDAPRRRVYRETVGSSCVVTGISCSSPRPTPCVVRGECMIHGSRPAVGGWSDKETAFSTDAGDCMDARWVTNCVRLIIMGQIYLSLLNGWSDGRLLTTIQE